MHDYDNAYTFLRVQTEDRVAECLCVRIAPCTRGSRVVDLDRASSFAGREGGGREKETKGIDTESASPRDPAG